MGELWRNFQRVSQSSGRLGGHDCGWLSLSELGMLFSDPIIVGLLMRVIPDSAGVEEAAVCHRLQSGLRKHCSENRTMRLEFRSLAALLLRLVERTQYRKRELGLQKLTSSRTPSALFCNWWLHPQCFSIIC